MLFNTLTNGDEFFVKKLPGGTGHRSGTTRFCGACMAPFNRIIVPLTGSGKGWRLQVSSLIYLR